MAVTKRAGSHNSGNHNSSTSITVTAGQAPVVGNRQVVRFFTRASSITAPTGVGWVKHASETGGDELAIFSREVTDTGETSWVFTAAATDQNAWTYDELEGVDNTDPVVGADTEPNTSGTSLTSGTVPSASGAVSGDYACAAFGSRANISNQSFTNSFTLAGNDATLTTVAEITTADKALTAGGDIETTMSWTTTAQTRGAIVVFRAAAGAGEQELTPALVSQLLSAQNPTITVGAVSLEPTLVSQPLTAIDPAITTGDVSIAPNLVSQPLSAVDPSVDPGDVSVSPSLVNQPLTVYDPEVELGTSPEQTIEPALVSQALSAIDPEILPGDVTIFPDLVTNLLTGIAPDLVAPEGSDILARITLDWSAS